MIGRIFAINQFSSTWYSVQVALIVDYDIRAMQITDANRITKSKKWALYIARVAFLTFTAL